MLSKHDLMRISLSLLIFGFMVLPGSFLPLSNYVGVVKANTPCIPCTAQVTVTGPTDFSIEGGTSHVSVSAPYGCLFTSQPTSLQLGGSYPTNYSYTSNELSGDNLSFTFVVPKNYTVINNSNVPSLNGKKLLSEKLSGFVGANIYSGRGDCEGPPTRFIKVPLSQEGKRWRFIPRERTAVLGDRG
jgi:hypothetical protein